MPKKDSKIININRNKIKDNKEETKPRKLKRIHLQLKNTKIYYVQVDVPDEDDYMKENLVAIRTAWDIINGKHEKLKPEEFICGDGFEQIVLKRENVKN